MVKLRSRKTLKSSGKGHEKDMEIQKLKRVQNPVFYIFAFYSHLSFQICNELYEAELPWL